MDEDLAVKRCRATLDSRRMAHSIAHVWPSCGHRVLAKAHRAPHAQNIGTSDGARPPLDTLLQPFCFVIDRSAQVNLDVGKR